MYSLTGLYSCFFRHIIHALLSQSVSMCVTKDKGFWRAEQSVPVLCHCVTLVCPTLSECLLHIIVIMTPIQIKEH